MANKALRLQAVQLRKEGKTFTEIKLALGVSKSTLFDWIHDLPLTSVQLQLLSENKQKRRYLTAEKIRIVKLEKRKRLFNLLVKELQSDLFPLTNKEIFLGGLFLYWGEGTKGYGTSISLTNTDSSMLKFFVHWLTKCFNIPKEKLRISLHLYSDMSISDSIEYWSNELQISTTQFIKPYIKTSKSLSLTQKGYGKGTCCVYVNNAKLKHRIMAYLNIFSTIKTQSLI